MVNNENVVVYVDKDQHNVGLLDVLLKKKGIQLVFIQSVDRDIDELYDSILAENPFFILTAVDLQASLLEEDTSGQDGVLLAERLLSDVNDVAVLSHEERHRRDVTAIGAQFISEVGIMGGIQIIIESLKKNNLHEAV